MASILNLDVKYYYDDSVKERNDRLVHENGVTYDISLYDASSGMQSLVPMVVLINYLLGEYFENYNKVLSFEQSEKNRELSWTVVRHMLSKYFPNKVTEENYREFYNDNVWRKYEQGDAEAKEIIRKMRNFYNQLVEPNSISFILEEPEQNIYPSTQMELVKEIVKACNGVHKSSALITTHSPYVLTVINNLIYAARVARLNPDAVDRIIPNEMWFLHIV